MKAEGCWAIFDMTHRSAMLAAAIKAVGAARRMWATCRRHLAQYPFDAAVMIDSPTLHLPLAKDTKRLGIPVFYYVAPQVWAWGEFRSRRIRRRVDKLACILPFEEAFFRGRGIDATFVGHPLFEVLADRTVDDTYVADLKENGSPLVAILPGSRRHVVEEVLPGQLAVAADIARRHADAHFAVSIAGAQIRRIAAPRVEASGLNASLHADRNGELLTAADLVLIASGTATLEAAFYRTPMVVMYNGPKWGYRLVGRWLIRTPHLSLVNILAGRRIVPEFMPYYTTTDPIAAAALELLGDPALRAETTKNLTDAVGPLLQPGASDNAAALLLGMIAKKSRTGVTVDRSVS
jgi:lipid-A-disaccharide synthase